MKLTPFLAAAALAAFTSGCTGSEDTGDVSLALTGQSPSGNIYRLRDAQIEIGGAGGEISFSTESDPNRTALTAHLAAGPYDLLLHTGWRLERVAADGTATDVEATLLSANPQTLEIIGGGTTFAALRFRTGGEDVAMGEGDLVVTIDVDDVDAGVVVDAPPQPPSAWITSGPNYPSSYGSVLFEFVYADGEPTCRVDALPFEPCAGGSYVTPSLGDGTHTFQLRVEGPGGVIDREFVYTIDGTPPTVQLVSVPSGVTGPVTIVFSTSGASGTSCRIDTGTNALCTSPWTTQSLAPGVHTVYVTAWDSAGNYGAAQSTFTTL